MNESQWSDVTHRLPIALLQLSNETTIFERLIYKSTNQHRRSLYFRRLVQVRRELRILQAARLSQLVENVGQYHKVMTESREGGTEALAAKDFKRRVYGAVELTQQIAEAVLCAGIKVAALLGQTFFMPFALTTLAILARLWVLSQQVLYDFVHLFNMLSTWPYHTLEKGNCYSLKLPSYLDCKFDDDGKISICAQPPHERVTDLQKGNEIGVSSSLIPDNHCSIEEEGMRKQDKNTELEQNITGTCKPNTTVKKVAYVSVCEVDAVETQKSDDGNHIDKKQKTDVFFDLLLGLQNISKDSIF